MAHGGEEGTLGAAACFGGSGFGFEFLHGVLQSLGSFTHPLFQRLIIGFQRGLGFITFAEYGLQ